MSSQDLTIRTIVEDHATQALAGIGGAASGLMGKLAGIGLAAGGISAVVGAAQEAGRAIVDLAEHAEALEKSQLRVSVVFGQSAEVVNKFADSAAEKLGITKQAALAAAGGVGQYLVNAGIAKDKSAGLAVSVVDMAGKLAKFNNISRDEAQNILQKGLTGSVRGLKQLGIALPDIPKGLSAAAKAQFIYNEVLKQSKPALDAVSKGVPSVAGGFKKIAAEIEDAKDEIGAKLLPLIAPMVSAFAAALPSALKRFEDAITAISAIVTPIFMPIVKLFAVEMPKAFEALLTALGSADPAKGLQKIGTSIAAELTNIGAAILPIVTAWAQSFVAWVSPIIPPLLAELAKLWVSFEGWLYGTALPAIIAKLAEWAKAFAAWIGPAIPPLLAKLGELLTQLGSWLTSTALPAIAAKLGEWAKAFGDWIVPAATAFLANWPSFLSGMLDALAGVAGFIVDHVLTWAEAFISWVPGAVQKLIPVLAGITAAIVAFIIETGATLLIKILSWIPALVGGMVRVGRDIVAALISALKTAIGAGIGLVTGALAGLAIAMINSIKAALGIHSPSTEFLSIGKQIIDGAISGINSMASAIIDAALAPFKGAIKAVKLLLGIASPSKVFEEIGQWITAGLASGIQKENYAAVEALNKIINSITGAVKAIPDFFAAVTKMIVPGDADIVTMRGQFTKVIAVLTDFVKDMSGWAAIITVGQGGFIPEAVKTFIKATTGRTFEGLITASDAENVGKLLGLISSIAGTWKTISETMTAITVMKTPAVGSLEVVKAAALTLTQMAKDIAGDMPPSIDLGPWSDALGAVVKVVTDVSKMDIGGAKAFRPGSLDIVRGMISELARLAGEVSAAVLSMPAERVRADFETIKAYMSAIASVADTVAKVGGLGATLKAAEAVSADMLYSVQRTMYMLSSMAAAMVKGPGYDLLADGETTKKNLDVIKALFDTLASVASSVATIAAVKLADAETITASQLSIVGTNASAIFVMMQNLSTAYRAIEDEVRTRLFDSMKAYADTLGAVVKGFADVAGLTVDWSKTTRIPAATLAIVRDNAVDMLGVMGDIVAAFGGLMVMTGGGSAGGGIGGPVGPGNPITTSAAGIGKGLAQAGRLLDLKAVKEFADALGGVVSVFSAAGGLTLDWSKTTRITAAALEVVKGNLIDFMTTLNDIVLMFTGGGSVSGAVVAPPRKGAGQDAIGRTLPELSQLLNLKAISEFADAAGKALDLMAKAGGITLDWSKVTRITADALAIIRGNITEALATVSAMAADWGATAGATEAGQKLMGDFVKYAADVLGLLEKAFAAFGKAQAVSKVGKNILDVVAINLRAVFGVLSGLASEVGPIAIKAAGEFAAAMGPALEVIGKALEVFAPDKILASPFVVNKQSNSRVMTASSRARAQALAVQVRDGIRLMLQTLADAMKTISPPSDETAKAIAAIVAAYAPIIDLIDKMAGLNVDLKKIDTIVKAATMLAGFTGIGNAAGGARGNAGGGAGGGGGSSGGGGIVLSGPITASGPVTVNGNQTVNVTVDGQTLATTTRTNVYQNNHRRGAAAAPTV